MAKTTLTLPERFDITGIETLKGRFQKALEKDATTIEINAHAVSNMDSSGAQLLLSFRKEAKSQEKEVTIIKASDDFNTASVLLGIQNLVS